jgi:hypothetical protein
MGMVLDDIVFDIRVDAGSYDTKRTHVRVGRLNNRIPRYCEASYYSAVDLNYHRYKSPRCFENGILDTRPIRTIKGGSYRKSLIDINAIIGHIFPGRDHDFIAVLRGVDGDFDCRMIRRDVDDCGLDAEGYTEEVGKGKRSVSHDQAPWRSVNLGVHDGREVARVRLPRPDLRIHGEDAGGNNLRVPP